jgi:hypothetical protein
LTPRGRPLIYLVKDYEGMRLRLGPGVPTWAAAVVRDDDVMGFRLDRTDRAPATSLELVLRHEVVHQVLNHLGAKLPRWFEEGLCVQFAGVPFLAVDHSVARLAAAGNLPTLGEAERGFSGNEAQAARAYKAGHSAVAYFLGRGFDVRELLARAARGEAFPDAFRAVTDLTLDAFEQAWIEDVTPNLPFLLFVLLENIELTLLVAGACIVAGGWVAWRLRRERAMRSLGE